MKGLLFIRATNSTRVCYDIQLGFLHNYVQAGVEPYQVISPLHISYVTDDG